MHAEYTHPVELDRQMRIYTYLLCKVNVLDWLTEAFSRIKKRGSVEYFYEVSFFKAFSCFLIKSEKAPFNDARHTEELLVFSDLSIVV